MSAETRETRERESFSKVPAIMCTICANKNVTRVEYAPRELRERKSRSYFLGDLFNKKRKINARAVYSHCVYSYFIRRKGENNQKLNTFCKKIYSLTYVASSVD